MDIFLWLEQFHLIRPYWLLAIIPLTLIIWFFSRAQAQSRNWASIIDKQLLPHLLQGVSVNKKSPPAFWLLIPGLLLIFALAGPAFDKRPQPVFKAQSALTIILDLSRSMDATDIKPSRLSRAHFKINDILKLRKEGQTSLIAYAADAFVITPLTDDAATIASQIPALQTNIMPGQGSRLDTALSKARELFINAGLSKGDIFIISDSIDSTAVAQIRQLKTEGFTTSVLAIGTAQGAPIADYRGGFVKDSSGNIVVPKLNSQTMQQAAIAGGGKFSLLSADDRDINYLMSNVIIDKNSERDTQLDAGGNKFETDVWHEEGPWLLLLVIPFAAYAFRKGLVFLLLVFVLPLPQPAQAFEWSDLWKNSNQRGEIALQQGDAETAADLFNDPQWKAAAHYKAGQYEESVKLLEGLNDPESNYNRGNALARAGKLDDAINAYNLTLKQQPEHEDALFNKKLLEKQKQQEQQQSKQNDKSDQSSGDKSDQSSDESQQQGSNSEQSQSEQNESSQSQSDQQQDNQPGNDAASSAKTDDSSEQKPSDASSQNNAEQQATKDEQEQQQQTENQNQPSDKDDSKLGRASDDLSPDLNQQQTQQWLKKIPDDPGALLRRKFKYQYSREKHGNEQKPW